MKRLIGLLLVVLLVAGIAFAGRNADPRQAALKMCTPKPSWFDRGTGIASDLGSIVPALNKPLPYGKMGVAIRGAWYTVGYWFGVFGAAVQGHPTPKPVIAPIDCGTLLDSCPSTTPPPPGGGVQPPPFNPKDLALGGGNPAVTFTGPDLAADALRRAGFPAAEIPTFVAIAKAESGFNPRAWNNYGAGMAGMFQLNQAYWKLSNWQDPYANAAMAKKVRDESVKAGHSPYLPWSTWRGAVANAGQYAKYAAVSNSPTPNTTQPGIPLDPMSAAVTQPACDPTLGLSGAQGGGPATVGQWNVLFSNSPARINSHAGFADLVCLNEIRHNSQLRVPGYSVTPGSMAVPIIWRPDRLDKLELHRTTVLTGYARDKSAVHGVWRNRATGKQFAVLCTHLLVQGGSGWQKQAANVNRIRDSYRARGLPVIMLGDMNAHLSKVSQFFAGNALGHNIDYAIGYGIKPSGRDALGYAGSDHQRVRFTFDAIDPGAKNTGAGSALIGGGAAPSRSGEAGIREVANRHSPTYIAPHRDPQGLPAFDIGSTGAKNSAIAEDMRQNHDVLKLRYVISQMRIASARSNWNWRPYSPITSAGDFRHVGHVHVSY